jgi:arabinogalactan oligomer/maltooligosaccharide transport system permease protein
MANEGISANLTRTLEYLSLSKPRRALYKFTHFFTDQPAKIRVWAQKKRKTNRERVKKTRGVFQTLADGIREGDWKTRLSYLFMGTGLVTRHQIIRGTLYFLYEVFFILFMVFVGGKSLAGLPSLGTVATVTYPYVDPNTGVEVPLQTTVDNSFTILLYSILTFVFMLIFIFLWYQQISDSLKLQRMSYIGRFASDRETLNNVLDRHYDRTLLFLPMLGLVLFTVIPIIMMIFIGFTDYDYQHLTPTNLFDWVGWNNFAGVFSSSGSTSSGNFLAVFGQVLLWTLCWAFFATFSNYFLGMIVAMIINLKGIKLKKLWRTILITTIAVPQFISLLLISKMFGDTGLVNGLFQKWGWISNYIPWLSSEWLAKVMIVLLNTWVGIPYTMLMCTGLLMNIPEDLYESARIDGASAPKMFQKITLPYMLFVTTPYLISQFVGNINNFNVIYFLSGGNPVFNGAGIPVSIVNAGLGKTDLLITWLYKMTVNSATKDYGTASVIGLLIFVVVAFFSLLTYNNSKSVQDEEAFQ